MLECEGCAYWHNLGGNIGNCDFLSNGRSPVLFHVRLRRRYFHIWPLRWSEEATIRVITRNDFYCNQHEEKT